MKYFIEMLENNNVVRKGAPLNSKDIILTQKELAAKGYPCLPVAFLDFLKIYNGVAALDSAILGIGNSISEDVASFNALYNHFEGQTILGYDDFAFLVYDAPKDKYFLLSQADGSEIDDFNQDEFVSALNSIIHI